MLLKHYKELQQVRKEKAELLELEKSIQKQKVELFELIDEAKGYLNMLGISDKDLEKIKLKEKFKVL